MNSRLKMEQRMNLHGKYIVCMFVKDSMPCMCVPCREVERTLLRRYGSSLNLEEDQIDILEVFRDFVKQNCML